MKTTKRVGTSGGMSIIWQMDNPNFAIKTTRSEHDAINEFVAYEIARVTGFDKCLNMARVSLPYKWSDDRSAVMLDWFTGFKVKKSLYKNPPKTFRTCLWLFDAIMGNNDRHNGNLGASDKTWHAIDHGIIFYQCADRRWSDGMDIDMRDTCGHMDAIKANETYLDSLITWWKDGYCQSQFWANVTRCEKDIADVQAWGDSPVYGTSFPRLTNVSRAIAGNVAHGCSMTGGCGIAH